MVRLPASWRWIERSVVEMIHRKASMIPEDFWCSDAAVYDRVWLYMAGNFSSLNTAFLCYTARIKYMGGMI